MSIEYYCGKCGGFEPNKSQVSEDFKLNKYCDCLQWKEEIEVSVSKIDWNDIGWFCKRIEADESSYKKLRTRVTELELAIKDILLFYENEQPLMPNQIAFKVYNIATNALSKK